MNHKSEFKLSLIAAIDENRGLGKDNQLLFKIPEDLKRFKKITTGHPVIMGRKTFESIGKILPNRTNIVLTRQTWQPPGLPKGAGVEVVGAVDKAIEVAKESPGGEEVFVIGGGSVYQQTIDQADKLYLTVVKGAYPADTFFPEYQQQFKKIVFEKTGRFKGFEYRFLEIEK